MFILEHGLPEYSFDLFMQGFARPYEYTNPLIKKKRRPLSASISRNILTTTEIQLNTLIQRKKYY